MFESQTREWILPVMPGSPGAVYIRTAEDVAWFWSQVAQAAVCAEAKHFFEGWMSESGSGWTFEEWMRIPQEDFTPWD